jgi:hypothetical protein
VIAKPKMDHVRTIVPSSVRALCTDYYKSAMFRELDARTQNVRRGILERFCQHKNDGDKPFALLLPRHIRARRHFGSSTNLPCATICTIEILLPKSNISEASQTIFIPGP